MSKANVYPSDMNLILIALQTLEVPNFEVTTFSLNQVKTQVQSTNVIDQFEGKKTIYHRSRKAL